MTRTIKQRCSWAHEKDEFLQKYHDEEWGSPVYDDQKLFKMLILESFQAGLSWNTILKKRKAFKEAFDQFDVNKVARYDESKIALLMQNKAIIRNRLKIKASIENACIFKEIQKEYKSFANYLWNFTDHKVILLTLPLRVSSALSDRISKDLQKRGMRFVGTIIIYSYLQAVGIINDHEEECYLYQSA